MKKQRAYWDMTTGELAEATKQFDDPTYEPPAVKPTSRELTALKRWQRRRVAARSRMTLSLEKSLIKKADRYASEHGQSVSELVADALRYWIQRRSA